MTWFKDSEPLDAKTRFTPYYDFYTKESSLKIDDVRPNDVGTYKCLAWNVAGTDETSAEAVIIKTPNIDENPYIDPEKFKNLNKIPLNQIDIPENKTNYMPPNVIVPLSNFKIEEGNDVVLTCKIDGCPIPKVIFFT